MSLRRGVVFVGVVASVAVTGGWGRAQTKPLTPDTEPLTGSTKPLMVEEGTYSIHLLQHKIGTESYTVNEVEGGRLVMTVTATSSDRGMKRTVTSTLEMEKGFAPMSLEQKSVATGGDEVSRTEIKGGLATVEERGVSRSMKKPVVAFVGFGTMPASMQMMMMRYWLEHHQPVRLPVLRASDKALPLEIKLVGHDAYDVKGRMVRLTRYTVANLMFGREILWLNDSGRLAAVMTFAGGLPQEEILEGYEPVEPGLYHSGVQQEMLDLADLGRMTPPIAKGAFAIVGARLIDGTGAAAVEDSAVVVKNGRIVAAGPRTAVKIPAGVRVIPAKGRTLLPGLWEMHVHYSGVEFGPALLAAGVTTARDCGGEFEFLKTARQKIDRDSALGPHLLLAGLIDSGGPLGFGYVNVNGTTDAVEAVDTYADAKFEQIKVYTQIQPDVLKAITAEAHAKGMTVTGHVPAAVDAFGGIADGMDQINHLQFVTRAMVEPGSSGAADPDSPRAKELIALLKEKAIVVDPTLGWGEMAGHPHNVPVESFEPGVQAAPYTLSSRFRAMGVPAADEAKWQERMATNVKMVGALYRAGVTIIPGSDTGLLGYGLDRELELYVHAGMTPMAAIQSATIVSARAMKLDKESGSIEVGKMADMVLVNGNPLENISDLRKVVSVVKDGRIYDSKALARSVGFNR